ncbi:hypothetical protein Nepgr_013482 [Nepenthes gracilis]|uniref:Uncharacterized protein n=1 Tax=Nepenthes gracilis TaxID=150966 RepID=A0AAD3XPE1_NEPGR|nr:hypothetical protein Nepgr_013482 [Nepenthes gracilis]
MIATVMPPKGTRAMKSSCGWLVLALADVHPHRNVSFWIADKALRLATSTDHLTNLIISSEATPYAKSSSSNVAITNSGVAPISYAEQATRVMREWEPEMTKDTATLNLWASQPSYSTSANPSRMRETVQLRKPSNH